MNFFGHAAVASWRAANPATALGAMLPDLAGMCRARLASVRDEDIASGVALHHHTDAVFHDLTGFVELCRHASKRLQGLGVARGAARATAHVAVELFLDGALLDDDAACQLYLAAIALAPEQDQTIAWQAADHITRWQELCKRLTRYGLPHGYREPGDVAQRITWILERRPRLALRGDEPAIVRQEMPALRDRVVAGAGDLFAALRAAL